MTQTLDAVVEGAGVGRTVGAAEQQIVGAGVEGPAIGDRAAVHLHLKSPNCPPGRESGSRLGGLTRHGLRANRLIGKPKGRLLQR